MKGLLLKDIYTLTKQVRIFLIMIICFSLTPNASMTAFAICYSAILPITALAYDERSKWDKLAMMMPYSVKELVFSKYLLGYLCMLVASILSMIGKIAFALIRHENMIEALIPILPLFCVGVLLQSLNFPFMFRFGVEKGRILYLGTTVIIVVCGLFLFQLVEDKISYIMEHGILYVVIFTLFTIISAIVSVLISIKGYQNKE